MHQAGTPSQPGILRWPSRQMMYPRTFYTDLNGLICKAIEEASVQSQPHPPRPLSWQLRLNEAGGCIISREVGPPTYCLPLLPSVSFSIT
jgi:hypothetical protein